MLELYYENERTIACLRREPLGFCVDGYAKMLSQNGHTFHVGRFKLHQVSELNQWLDAQSINISDLSNEVIDGFVPTLKNVKTKKSRIKYALIQFLGYLRQLGVIEHIVQPKKETAWSSLLADFENYLETERKFYSPNLATYISSTDEFLSDLYHRKQIIEVENLTPTIIQKYYQRYLGKDYSMKKFIDVSKSLRCFLRYIFLTGIIRTDLSGCILSRVKRKPTLLPKSLPPNEIENVLRAVHSKEDAHSIRNYAILLLLARLGLRSIEIVNLTLDDIDWANGSVTVRGKAGREDMLPLPNDVGRALVGYLEKVRPPSEIRSVFLCMNAPIRKLSGSVSVSSIAAKALVEAGIDDPPGAAHLFRHSLACKLLKAGSSLLQIGQILRHEHPDTTAIYAKCDVDSLSNLSQPWPKGGVL